MGTRGGAVLTRPARAGGDLEVFEETARAQDAMYEVQHRLRVSVADAARELGVTPQTIRNWIHDGVIDAEKSGRDFVVSGVTLYELMRITKRVQEQNPDARVLPHVMSAMVDSEVMTTAVRNSPELMSALRLGAVDGEPEDSVFTGRPEHREGLRAEVAASNARARDAVSGRSQGER